MRSILSLMITALPVLAVTPAASDTLRFRGLAAAACSLAMPTDGVIALQSDLQSWATTQPATIQAMNTAPATVTVTRPSSWAVSPTSTPSTIFTHTAALAGINVGTLVGQGNATSGPLTALGTTTVSVNLGATATSVFRAGNYEVDVTVTCTVP